MVYIVILYRLFKFIILGTLYEVPTCIAQHSKRIGLAVPFLDSKPSFAQSKALAPNSFQR